MNIRAGFLSLVGLSFVINCAAVAATFAQYPGFDEIRAGLSDALPSSEDRELLRQHRPILHVPEGEEGPIDFYDDYVGSGDLFDGEGVHLAHDPDAAALNAVRDMPEAVFVHHPTTEANPAGYGSVVRATLTLSGGAEAFTFLGYHFVFRHSGLPAGVSPLYLRLADIFADSADWHQLDHYTAAFVVLRENTPFAVILQQHNHMRTYFMRDEPSFADGQILLDVALSSNELYPHREGKVRRRTAGDMNAKTTPYLTGQSESGGWRASDDITVGGREVEYALKFLPPDDAFYVFQGRLGEPRRLPGRNGPPGAIYRTLPKLWHLQTALYVFYWTDDDPEYAQILADEGISDTAMKEYLRRFESVFYQHVSPRN